MTVPLGAPDEAAVSVGSDGIYLDIHRDPSGSSASGYWRFPLVLRTPLVSAVAGIELAGWGGGAPGLIGFFDDLATNWHGWDGVKKWSDDEGGIRFRATHPRTGPILLSARLDPGYGFTGVGSWVLEIVIPVEPGQLESIAMSVRSLFEAGR